MNSTKWWGAVSEAKVADFAAAILDENRKHPIVIVTTPTYTTPDRIPQDSLKEAQKLRAEIGDIADVAIVATGSVSFALEELLPKGWQVFNGFCRSYPPNILNNPDLRRTPLRHRRKNEEASERVIGDALAQANAAGLFEQRSEQILASEGTITGFLLNGEQALIDIGASMPAMIWADITCPGIPLDWLVAKGDRVPGVHDKEHNRFILRRHTFGTPECFAAFPSHSVTLALVGEVSAESAELKLHPDLSVTVRQTDVSSNPLDLLDLFFFEGEVVRVRVIHLSTGKVQLRLSDIDDDETVLDAVAVVEGGRPWLEEDRSLPSPTESSETEAIEEVLPHNDESIEAPTETAASAADAPEHELEQTPSHLPGPRPSTGPVELLGAPPQQKSDKAAINQMALKIEALTATIKKLERQAARAELLEQQLAVNTRNLQLVKAELGDALAEIKRRKEQHKSAVTQLRLTRKPTPEAPREQTARDRRQQWGDDEAWMRHEIYLTWAERVLPTEKQQFVLPDDYTFGPRFFESLQPLDEGQLEKALKCILDVLIDRAKNIPGRDLHPLRQGSGGSDPQRVREDGARGWRAAIEINAASARRLHFWVNGTQIELSQVSVHDDMQA